MPLLPGGLPVENLYASRGVVERGSNCCCYANVEANCKLDCGPDGGLILVTYQGTT